jgi:hypothetical protein
VRAGAAGGFQNAGARGRRIANRALTCALTEAAEAAGLRCCCPAKEYCTDNAAMIGCAGLLRVMEESGTGWRSTRLLSAATTSPRNEQCKNEQCTMNEEIPRGNFFHLYRIHPFFAL